MDELGLLWRAETFELPRLNLEELQLDTGLFPTAALRQLASQPVVSDGRVFLQHHREIVALTVATGKPAWRYRADPGGLLPPEEFDTQVPRWYAVTLAGGHVYATLPGALGYLPEYEDAGAGSGGGLPASGHGGRALAPHSGGVAARGSGSQLRLLAAGRARTGLRRASAPAFVRLRGLLPLQLRRPHRGPRSFTPIWAAARWARSAPAAPRTAPPAYLDDTVFVCTNLGTIAALSAATGDMYAGCGSTSATPRTPCPLLIRALHSALHALGLQRDPGDALSVCSACPWTATTSSGLILRTDGSSARFGPPSWRGRARWLRCAAIGSSPPAPSAACFDVALARS